MQFIFSRMGKNCKNPTDLKQTDEGDQLTVYPYRVTNFFGLRPNKYTISAHFPSRFPPRAPFFLAIPPLALFQLPLYFHRVDFRSRNVTACIRQRI